MQLLDDKERLRSFDRTGLRSARVRARKSPMPSYRDKFNAEEMADVVRYLTR